MADLCASLLIEVWVELVAAATVDGGEVLGDLLIAFARVGCAQFVETFEVMLMEDVTGGAHDALLEIEVALVRCKQVAAIVGRCLFGVLERVANMVIRSDPTRRYCTAATAFGAVLDVDLAVVFGFALEARQVG